MVSYVQLALVSNVWSLGKDTGIWIEDQGRVEGKIVQTRKCETGHIERAEDDGGWKGRDKDI